MNTKDKSKTALILMEIIIALGIFAVASAICIKVFALSYEKSDSARKLNEASIIAESIAETLRATECDMNDFIQDYPDAFVEGNVVTVPGENVDVTIEFSEDKYLRTANLKADSAGKTVYELVVKVAVGAK